MSIKSSGARYDPGTEVNPLQSGVAVPAKSFIVGKYDDEGRRKVAGALVEGSPEAARLTKLLVKSMSTRGGELMPGYIMTNNGPMKATKLPQTNIPKPTTTKIVEISKPKKGRKKKDTTTTENYLQTVTESIQPIPESTYEIAGEPEIVKTETYPVTFVVESGKIKTSTVAILEDDLGLMLVYENEDSISYVPNRGGHLTLILPGKREISVMFLGIQLRWYNTNEQLLLFVKTKTN